MTIRLTVRRVPPVGLEAEEIRPEILQGKTENQIQRIPVWAGKRKLALGQIFNVQILPSGQSRIEILGDSSRIKRIGEGMESGEIIIRGNAGMHLGARMSGGSILVLGSTSSWCGAEMSGGSIEVHGSAGDYLGGAYRGSLKGMQGGSITVRGRCGSEVGAAMAGGTITVSAAGTLAGVRQSGGLIRILGAADPRAGLGMTGGTIVIQGKTSEPIPGALYRGTVDSDHLDIPAVSERFMSFSCDMAERKQGLLLISEAANSKISSLFVR